MAGYLQPFHCVCCGVGATIFSTIIVVVFRKRNRAGALNTQFGRFRRPSLPKDFLPSSFTIYFLITRGIAPIGDNYAISRNPWPPLDTYKRSTTAWTIPFASQTKPPPRVVHNRTEIVAPCPNLNYLYKDRSLISFYLLLIIYIEGEVHAIEVVVDSLPPIRSFF